jgi:serine/threonine protein kinase
MTLLPDTVLDGHYRISYVADERRSSPIYRAYDQRDGRRVLICTFDASHYQPEELRVTAAQLSELNTPGMLRLLDHFAIEGGYALVAEDPGGQDLDRLLRDQGGALPERHMLEQARVLLNALAQAHAAQPPLHLGDLRSSDIWATPERELRLAPFAFARHIGGGNSPYLAPELLQEGNEPTQTSDLYALGAVLYQLASGWSPPNVQQRQLGTPLASW